jgi:hypothetical protein
MPCQSQLAESAAVIAHEVDYESCGARDDPSSEKVNADHEFKAYQRDACGARDCLIQDLADMKAVINLVNGDEC